MVDIQNITVDFGGVRAVNDLCVMIDQPIVGMIGPNGAGKTTLLNVLSGFVRPTRGTVMADGTNLLSLSPEKRARWGMRRTFQTEQVVDDLNVWDNIALVLDHVNQPRSERHHQVQAALDFVGLRDQAHSMGASLNATERRMIEIGRAIVGKPKLILMDEPGAGLSASEGDALRDRIKAIPPKFGATVVLIDHDVELIAAVCAFTAVLDFGSLVAYGPTHEVMKDKRVKQAYMGIAD
jgi:branched-chain amino acid transport system ATP-binding protein